MNRRGWGAASALSLESLPQKKLDRFWAKVDKQGPFFQGSRCWIWIGRRGPGTTTFPMWQVEVGRIVGANRVAWVLQHGPLEEGQVLTQQCSSRLCVRHWVAADKHVAIRHLQRYRETAETVQSLRKLHLAGAGCGELTEAVPYVHETVWKMITNRRWVDPEYEAPPRDRRRDHPELFRFSPDEVEAIHDELRSGASISQIARWAGAPITTVWEVVNGPSLKSRRKDAA